MMSKQFSPTRGILSKVAAIAIMLMIGVLMSFSQKTNLQNYGLDNDNDWWYPILVKHNIVLNSSFKNFDYVFEMGVNTSKSKSKATLINAVIIYKVEEGYDILKASNAYHDLETKTIKVQDAQLSMFRFWGYEDMPKSVERRLFDEFTIQFHDDNTITSSGKLLVKWESKNGKGNVIRTDDY